MRRTAVTRPTPPRRPHPRKIPARERTIDMRSAARPVSVSARCRAVHFVSGCEASSLEKKCPCPRHDCMCSFLFLIVLAGGGGVFCFFLLSGAPPLLAGKCVYSLSGCPRKSDRGNAGTLFSVRAAMTIKMNRVCPPEIEGKRGVAGTVNKPSKDANGGCPAGSFGVYFFFTSNYCCQHLETPRARCV